MSLPLAAIGAVIAALLETSVASELTVAGFKPDLIYVFAVVSAMIIGAEEGLVWAFLGGLMLDVLSPERPIGATMLSLLLVVGLAIAIARLLGPSRLLISVVAAFVLTWLYQLTVLAVLSATSGLAVTGLPLRAAIPVALMNGLLAIAVAFVARWAMIRFGPPERVDW